MSSPAPHAVSPGVCLVVEASTAAGSMALLRRLAHDTALVQPARPAIDVRTVDLAHEQRWHVMASVAIPMGSGRQDLLTPALMPLLMQAGCTLQKLRAIACGAGPGSFTSLRIAGAFAKGLAFGLEVPLYALPSLLLVSASETAPLSMGRYLVIADALRNEVYAQPCDVSHAGEMTAVSDVFRVHEDALHETAHGRSIVRVSPTDQVRARATSARFLGDWSPYGPVNVDEWEPAYGRLAEAQVKWEAAHGRALGD